MSNFKFPPWRNPEKSGCFAGAPLWHGFRSDTGDNGQLSVCYGNATQFGPTAVNQLCKARLEAHPPDAALRAQLALLADDRCGAKLMKQAKLDTPMLRAAVDAVRGNRRVTSRSAEATYEALDPRKSFATPLDVPLFCIDALRLAPTEPAPWYFSSKDLLDTWEQASGRPREEAYDSISMMNLREMLKVLKSPKVPVKPSTFLAAMANLEAVGRR